MDLPTVSHADGEEDVDRDTIQAGEQIARWTRARELGLDDGTRLWFQALEQAEEPLTPEYSIAVEFGPNCGSESCPTRLFVNSDDVLLDYYGILIDV